MAQWVESINIVYINRLYFEGKITVQQSAKTMVAKLKKLQAWHVCEPDLINVVSAFDTIDAVAEHQDYIAALAMLYDYGDKNHNLWVETVIVEPKNSDDDIPTATHNPFNTPSSYNKTYPIPSVVLPAVIVPEVLANPNAITCAAPPGYKGKIYPATRTNSYIGEPEFNKKLEEANIVIGELPKELYTYIKAADEYYRTWLFERWHNNNLIMKNATEIGLEEVNER